jgi:hypothetical protein
MQRTWKIWLPLIGLSFVLLLSGAASQDKTKTKTSNPQTTQKVKRVSTPVYQPPRRGAPRGRVGGGSRGPGDNRPVLSVLVPDHTALTVQEAPTLYWYISSRPDHPIELTIIDEHSIKPLLETRVYPKQPGIQEVRLNKHHIRLSPGIKYQWFVALVIDAANRSKDIIAGGWLERIEPSHTLQEQLTRAERTEMPFIYAEAGIWYDALEAISDLIDASPDNPVPRQQRAALLEQVGLTEIAMSDAPSVTTK